MRHSSSLLLTVLLLAGSAAGATVTKTIPAEKSIRVPPPPAGTEAIELTFRGDVPPWLVKGVPAESCASDRVLLCTRAPRCTAKDLPPPLIGEAWFVLDKLASGSWGMKGNPVDKNRLERIRGMAATFHWLVAGACYVGAKESPKRCESTAGLPSASAIRGRLQAVTGAAPAALRPALAYIATQGDAELTSLFSAAVVAARCRTDAAPGPADPYRVPAAQVKAWLLGVVDGDSPHGLQVLRPLLERLPAEAVKWGWLRAVELRRGTPVRL